MVKKLLTFFVSAIFSIAAMAQDVMVSGKVTDANGAPLPGAIVVEKGTNNAVRTALDGTYKLTIPGNRVPTSILIRSTGAGSEEFSIDGKSESVEFNPSLGAQKQKISEVVVTSASKKSEKVLNAPASVSVLSEARIEQNTSLSPVDNLRKVAAVDIMPTGLVSNNVNVRGFNGIFSGSMLYLVDNRIASVPSLRVNAFQLVPTANTDLRSMEVVRGPASALYGPFASQGVLAMYTKSPLDMENRMEVTVGLTSGLRAGDEDQTVTNINGKSVTYKADNSFENLSILNPEIRIAGKLSDKVGVKVSASHMQATDFAFYDNRESNGEKVVFGNRAAGNPFVASSDSSIFNRNFKIRKISADARLDWRPVDGTEFVFSYGYSNNTNMELTGLGAAQAVDWSSNYFQARAKFGKLFIQYFINQTNSGNTYLIPQNVTGINKDFAYLRETSNLQSFQAQHSADLLKNRLNLIYGLDVYLTRPRGNVYGRFDNGGANINQYGLYGQGKYEFNKQWSFTGALRADYQDVIDEWMFSPRAALVFKPTENRTLRLTYNRAFQAPSALNFFLDINNGNNVRAFGNTTGFNYNFDANGNPIYNHAGGFRSGMNSQNTINQMAAIFQARGLPAQFAQPTADGLFNNVQTLIDITQFAPAYGKEVQRLVASGVNPAAAQFRALAPAIAASKVNADISKYNEPVRSTVTQTLEVGYKGYLMDKLTLGVDLYYTRMENFVSPLTASSFAVVTDVNVLAQNIEYAKANYPQLAGFFNSVSIDQLYGLYTNVASGLPATNTNSNFIRPGSAGVFPTNTGTGSDFLLTYFNLGTVDVAGADFSANYQASNDLMFDFAYSHINKDKIPLEGAAGGFVGLNAPQHKTALTIDYKLPIDHKGVSMRAGWRWMDKFDANSAVYIGRVNAANLFDLGFSWKPSKSAGTILSLNANNLLDHRHMFFPGTPAIGRVVLFKIQHTFGVK